MINMLQMQGLLTPLRNLSFIKCVQYITCIIIYTVACYNVLINYAYSEYIIGKKEELLTYRGLTYTYAAKPLLIFRYVYTCTVLYTVQCTKCSLHCTSIQLALVHIVTSTNNGPIRIIVSKF